MRALAWTPARAGYALYAAVTFLALGLTALTAALALPGVSRRRAAARALARAFLRLAGMPLTVRGLERLAPGQCVVVANHASYLDGLVFTAALPARFGFVIKREMSAVPLAGLFLRRIGSEFVERFDRHRGAADARRVLRNAANGHSLVFFPEGTFTRTPGLLKFHTGAFVTAVRAGCPVIPAVVRGTRMALSPTSALPRPGRIEVEILPPVEAEPDAVEACSALLRDRARQAILLALGEPDLTCSGDSAHPPRTEHERSARASSS
ncbi:MAG TPA: lysophospholipid acyltransferase family protein [Steroidobacteraceae bacterium]|nr:lysophospholipid acyltransferase family protein [Steroidobacteraceae bacterium]